MGALTRELVVSTLSDPTNPKRQQLYNEVTSTAQAYLPRYSFAEPLVLKKDFPDITKVDVAAAHKMYDHLRAHVLHTGYFSSKQLRPYEWNDLSQSPSLDQEDVWWGFEFETGYQTQEAREKAITHCWDSYDNVTFDAEGEGDFYSEITFPPANQSGFKTEADATKYINFLSENSELVHNTGQSMIGTHFNMSTPSMRDISTKDYNLNYRTQRTAAYKMNQCLGSLALEDNLKLFGRERLYGGFYHNTASSNDKYNSWFEGKLFRTTYDSSVFQRYLSVCDGLTKAIQFFLENPEARGISNFLELLSSPDTTEIVEGTMLNVSEYDDDDDWGCDCDECRSDREETY